MNPLLFFLLLIYNVFKGIDLKEHPHFLKILEDEYAAKYLDVLGIDPSQRAKREILKYHPFHLCEFERSWNTDG